MLPHPSSYLPGTFLFSSHLQKQLVQGHCLLFDRTIEAVRTLTYGVIYCGGWDNVAGNVADIPVPIRDGAQIIRQRETDTLQQAAQVSRVEVLKIYEVHVVASSSHHSYRGAASVCIPSSIARSLILCPQRKA